MSEEFEKFIGRIVKIGNSQHILIPAHILKYAGLKEKDIVKIMIRKYEKPQTNKKPEDL